MQTLSHSQAHAATVSTAARNIADKAKSNQNITAQSLRQEAEDGLIDGWLSVCGVSQCNFSQWTAAMFMAANLFELGAA